MRLDLLAFVVLCLPLAALAQVYKWVDDNGVTHYDATPPRNAKSREIQLRDPTGGTGGKPPAASPSVADQEAGFRQRRILRAQAEAREKKDRAQQAQREARCRDLRSETDIVKNPARRVAIRDERGRRIVLSGGERDALVAKNEEELRRSCP